MKPKEMKCQCVDECEPGKAQKSSKSNRSFYRHYSGSATREERKKKQMYPFIQEYP